MKKTLAGLRLSASELSNHLACRHCTAADMVVASGELAAPTLNSPDTQILRDLGLAHQNDYVLPKDMYVVVSGKNFMPERFRTLDYASCYRLIKSRMEAVIQADDTRPTTYPEPTSHCEICGRNLECLQSK
jgi:hypothetical protein